MGMPDTVLQQGEDNPLSTGGPPHVSANKRPSTRLPGRCHSGCGLPKVNVFWGGGADGLRA